MLLRHDLAPVQRLGLGDVGQDRIAFLVLSGFVLALVVEGEETV